jgi:hypothetical protein
VSQHDQYERFAFCEHGSQNQPQSKRSLNRFHRTRLPNAPWRTFKATFSVRVQSSASSSRRLVVSSAPWSLHSVLVSSLARYVTSSGVKCHVTWEQTLITFSSPRSFVAWGGRQSLSSSLVAGRRGKRKKSSVSETAGCVVLRKIEVWSGVSHACKDRQHLPSAVSQACS